MARYTRDVGHPMNQAVAAELRAELARHRGMTQQDVVDRSGLPVNTVGKIFRGEAMIDVKQLEAVALALHVHPSAILARAEAELARSKPRNGARATGTGDIGRTN